MLMPSLGYLLGIQFEHLITSIDHWIAFFLLLLIGGKMIQESREENEELDDSFAVRTMLMLAIATSIDALAVGITFAFLQVDIVPAVLFIGVVTFLFSAAGIRIGHVFGVRYKAKAELAGGLILIFYRLQNFVRAFGMDCSLEIGDRYVLNKKSIVLQMFRNNHDTIGFLFPISGQNLLKF